MNLKERKLSLEVSGQLTQLRTLKSALDLTVGVTRNRRSMTVGFGTTPVLPMEPPKKPDDSEPSNSLILPFIFVP